MAIKGFGWLSEIWDFGKDKTSESTVKPTHIPEFKRQDIVRLNEDIRELGKTAKAGDYEVSFVGPERHPNSYVLLPVNGGDEVVLPFAYAERVLQMEKKFIPEEPDVWAAERYERGMTKQGINTEIGLGVHDADYVP